MNLNMVKNNVKQFGIMLLSLASGLSEKNFTTQDQIRSCVEQQRPYFSTKLLTIIEVCCLSPNPPTFKELSEITLQLQESQVYSLTNSGFSNGSRPSTGQVANSNKMVNRISFVGRNSSNVSAISNRGTQGERKRHKIFDDDEDDTISLSEIGVAQKPISGLVSNPANLVTQS